MIFTSCYYKMVYAGFPFHENSSSVNAKKLTRVGTACNHVVQVLSVVQYAPDILLVRTTIMDIIFRDFLILYQIFFSPQVKQSVIITNKHGIYELPYECPNDLRLRKLPKIRKISKHHRIIT